MRTHLAPAPHCFDRSNIQIFFSAAFPLLRGRCLSRATLDRSPLGRQAERQAPLVFLRRHLAAYSPAQKVDGAKRSGGSAYFLRIVLLRPALAFHRFCRAVCERANGLIPHQVCLPALPPSFASTEAPAVQWNPSRVVALMSKPKSLSWRI